MEFQTGLIFSDLGRFWMFVILAGFLFYQKFDFGYKKRALKPVLTTFSSTKGFEPKNPFLIDSPFISNRSLEQFNSLNQNELFLIICLWFNHIQVCETDQNDKNLIHQFQTLDHIKTHPFKLSKNKLKMRLIQSNHFHPSQWSHLSFFAP